MKLSKEERSKQLKEKVKEKITTTGISIPDLCRAVSETDEYKLMHVISELEDSGEIILNGFDRIYQEDGGAIYLAKYSKKAS